MPLKCGVKSSKRRTHEARWGPRTCAGDVYPWMKEIAKREGCPEALGAVEADEMCGWSE